jgi:mannose-6-phosphate isomerase-like protein (cupin superfamily)
VNDIAEAREESSMPVIRAENAPQFALPGLTFTGLAAPSRGARETSVWRFRVEPGVPGTPHSVDREEIFVVLRGTAVAVVGGERLELGVGDALVVPPDVEFSLANPGTEVFEAMAVAPAGVRASMPRGEPFAPPWTQ